MQEPSPTRKDSWRAKSLRSTFGKQCLASLPSAPACGFGSANRDGTGRVSWQPAWR